MPAGEAGGRQHLYAVADGEDPFFGAVEGAQDVEQGLVVAQILGGAPAKQEDRLVVLDTNLVEGEVGFQTISAAFDVGVPAGLKIVHDQVQAPARGGGHNGLPALLLKAVNRIEGFVGLAAVSGDDEDFRHPSNLTRLVMQALDAGAMERASSRCDSFCRTRWK